MSEIILIQVTGEDEPGLTASLMPILSDHDVNILDIGQAVIPRQASFSTSVPSRTRCTDIREIYIKSYRLINRSRPQRFSFWLSSTGPGT